ncbi:MAG: hypothetical protein ABSE67_14545 [Xanthobacteraceae bacterium]|jgi:hypothetical protein
MATTIYFEPTKIKDKKRESRSNFEFGRFSNGDVYCEVDGKMFVVDKVIGRKIYDGMMELGASRQWGW